MLIILACILIFISRINSGDGSNHHETQTDRETLIAFRSGIKLDPRNSLSDWGSAVHFCNWTGVSCNTSRNRVVKLDLSRKGLRGVISPVISNLSWLSILDLSDNSLTGEIPREIGSLTRLMELSLSSNFLKGFIPEELGSLGALYYLDIGGNKLSGSIPAPLFCNTSLQYIDLSNNSLTGEIPLSNDCRLADLMFLLLWSNNLEGRIPKSLSNSTKLKWIDLESNFLSGELPTEVFDQTPVLQSLHLSYNNFSSHDENTNLTPFFASLTNCSFLQEIELAGNNLAGQIPPIIGDLSLNLLQLQLEDNLISGSIPPNITNLVNLTYLNLSKNYLNGSIPEDISKLQRLERFYLSNNMLSGEIPACIGEIPQLGLLDMSGNFLSGPIPHTLCNLSQLRSLLLHNNQLSGAIPSALGGCTNLEILDLSHNRLSGRIPSDIAALSNLKLYLNLSSNLLEGPLPVQLSKLDMILALDLSSNNLSGTIPPQLASCIALEYLNFSNNLLEGSIPISVGGLPFLQILDLSSNQLAGNMPQSLQESKSLKQLNFSYNKLSGVIPKRGIFASLSLDSFLGNPDLCGSIPGIRRCGTKLANRMTSKLPITLTFIAMALTICLFAFRLVTKSTGIKLLFRQKLENDDYQWKRDYPRITYHQLVEATGGFSESTLIGSGRFGHVHKGVLRDKTNIAVKVLETRSGSDDDSKSFKRECEVLKRTRHRNLIRIITTCSHIDFKAIVLPLMSNGSLESRLYPTHHMEVADEKRLNLVQMVKIMSDIAEGMAYLHHYSPVRVIHCDLKPSNVLLDDDFTAVVSDFGIARLVKGAGDESGPDSSPCTISTTGLLHGSIGYIAPEYGLGGHPSTQGDVYSFGVLILEMITGTRPTDVIFHEGLTLHEWVKSYMPDDVETLILLSRVQFNNDEQDDDENFVIYCETLKRNIMIELIELGLVCTQSNPSLRPTMMDAAGELQLLKRNLSRHLGEFSRSVSSATNETSF